MGVFLGSTVPPDVVPLSSAVMVVFLGSRVPPDVVPLSSAVMGRVPRGKTVAPYYCG